MATILWKPAGGPGNHPGRAGDQVMKSSQPVMELHFRTFGQGDPIIILHGMFGALGNWQTLGKQLAADYMVFLVDLRNHGRAPHTDVKDYPAMADDLNRFMEAQWIHRAHIIGHSMGGKTAMQFALAHPDMVDHLIVVDIAPRRYEAGHQEIFEALFSVDLERVGNRQDADELLSEKIKDAGIRRFLLKNLDRESDGTYYWKMNLPVIYDHYSDLLAEVKGGSPFEGPALFIGGARSDYIRAGDRDDILRLFPRATVEFVNDAGHWVHAEQPGAMLQLIRRFLAAP